MINSGLFLANFVNVFVSISPLVVVIVVGCVGLAQLILGLIKNELSNTEIQGSYAEIDDVKVRLNFFNLFKTFKSSLILTLIYLFYCSIALDMEINHMFNYHETAKHFVMVPFIYALAHSLLETTRKRVKNLNALSLVILGLQIVCSVVEFLLKMYYPNEFLEFMFFVFNLVLFQKLIFINFTVSLLGVFDIDNVRICNYVNCRLNSAYQQNTILRQLRFFADSYSSAEF